MGNACGHSAGTDVAPTYAEEVCAPSRLHRFASVIDKDGEETPPNADNSNDAPPDDAKSAEVDEPAKSKPITPPHMSPGVAHLDRALPHKTPQRTPASAPLERSARVVTSPVTPHQRATGGYSLLDVIEADQNLPMSKLAGPMMESKATNASESLTQSMNVSAILSMGSTFVGETPPPRVPLIPMPIWKGTRQPVVAYDENNISNGNVFHLSLSSIPTPSMQSPVGSNGVRIRAPGELFDQSMTPCSSSIA